MLTILVVSCGQVTLRSETIPRYLPVRGCPLDCTGSILTFVTMSLFYGCGACPSFLMYLVSQQELRQKLHAVGGERDSKQDPSVLDPRSRANRLSAAAAEPMPSPIASLEDASDVSAEITPTVSSPGAVHVPRWQTSKHSAASWRSRDSTSPRIFQPGAASLASQVCCAI